MTKAISPAPLPARCASISASSSLEICLPSTQSATRYAPLRTEARMASASFCRALAICLSLAFLSARAVSGSSMMRKLQNPPSRLRYSSTPAAK